MRFLASWHGARDSAGVWALQNALHRRGSGMQRDIKTHRQSSIRCSAGRFLTSTLLALIVLTTHAETTNAAEPLTSINKAVQAAFDDFSRGIGEGISRTSPALFPPIQASANLAVRAAMPLASTEAQTLLLPLLRSGRHETASHGALIDDTVALVEQQLQEDHPRASIRPRHIAIHCVVNLGFEDGHTAVPKPERDVSYLVIRAREFDDPLNSVAQYWEIFLPETTDEDALLALFADRDTVRRILEYQVPPSDEALQSSWDFSETVTVTLVFDVFESSDFIQKILIADSTESANEMVIEWLADHPVRMDSALTYEIMNEGNAPQSDIESLTIETVRRQFEFDGKQWKLLTVGE